MSLTVCFTIEVLGDLSGRQADKVMHHECVFNYHLKAPLVLMHNKIIATFIRGYPWASSVEPSLSGHGQNTSLNL